MNKKHIIALVGYIKQSRRYGSTYIHADVRKDCMSFDCVPSAEVDGRGVKLSFCSYGRSLQSGGHKYKAHAYYRDTGKPVPSKKLNEIV